MGVSFCSTNAAENVSQTEERLFEQKYNKITLYWHMIDPNSRAIKSLLIAGGVKHHDVYLDLSKNEHKEPEILELNPSGQIPFLTVDEQTYVESSAILRLLCRICPELETYYPMDVFARAKIDQMLDFKGTSFGLASQRVINCCYQMGEKMKEGENVDEQMELYNSLLEPMHVQYEILESKLQNSQFSNTSNHGNTILYLCDRHEPSIADFALGCQAMDLMLLGQSYENYPCINQWLGNLLMSTDGFRALHEDYFSALSKQQGVYPCSLMEPLNCSLDWGPDATKVNEILNFCFVPQKWDRHHFTSHPAMKRNLKGSPQLAQQLREKFTDDLELLLKGRLEHWKRNHQAALAYIIMSDQFSKHIYKGTSKAFTFDPFAQKMAKAIVKDKARFAKYRLFEKLNIIMPLMNSEYINDVKMSRTLLEQLQAEARNFGLHHIAKSFMSFHKLIDHNAEILEQYGRYPLRNEILGRKPKKNELQIMENPEAAVTDNNARQSVISELVKDNDDQLQLVYFDAHGRALQIRMLLHYCNVQFDDKRVTSSEEFMQMKQDGELIFGQLPQLVTDGGQTMAQTQAIMRYIGQCYRGGAYQEQLYPGKEDPDACYEIDSIVEYSNDFMRSYLFMIPKLSFYDPSPEKVNAFNETQWKALLEFLDKKLECNSGNLFLVGEHMTIADISVGAHFLMLLFNPNMAHREMFEKQMKTHHPLVATWAEKTVYAKFNEWFTQQPMSEFGAPDKEESPRKNQMRTSIVDSVIIEHPVQEQEAR